MSNEQEPAWRPRTLSEEAARRILARASEIDSARSAELALEDLRQASLEAGIAPNAFEQALVEVSDRGAAVDSARGAGTFRGRLSAALLSTSKTVGVTLATMLVLMLLIDWLG